MDWNWLHSLGYGLLSGLTEILPVSSLAHQRLFQVLTGTDETQLAFRLFCHLGVIAALLYNCRSAILRLRRTRMIARRTKGRRQPTDLRGAYDMRVLRVVLVLTLLSFVAYPALAEATGPLWMCSVMLFVNGIILFIPTRLPSGNKDSRGMSGLDSLLMGVGSALAAAPGISRTATCVSFAQARGVERNTALEFALLICISALALTLGFDIFALFGTGHMQFSMLLHYLLSALAAFGGAHAAVSLMRYLAVKTGYGGFAYYCWGAALFLFIVYLST